MHYQLSINKIYLYVKDPYEEKYQFLIKKRESKGLKHLIILKVLLENKNIREYNIGKKRKALIAIDDMIADVINNKKLNPVVTELFIRVRKLNISVVTITQSNFNVLKDVRLYSTYFFIMKIFNNRELQQVALNHSSDIDFKDFIRIF